jgi:AhpD family alkylhydroperoxidase
MSALPNLAAMSQRIRVDQVQRDAYQALAKADKAAGKSLKGSLRHLIKLRASQINGCAYCIDMHSKDARREGEREQRLYALDAWRETSFYSERERAALAFTEAATLLPDTHVPDEVYSELEQHFDTDEIGALIVTVAVINAWNRIAVSSREPAGSYRLEEAR